MDISREKQSGGWVELRVRGRLDNYWADHFKTALADLLREGASKVRLNLAGVSYLSSAGIGALVWGHKQLESVRGRLVVANPSEPVKEVLEVTRLTTLLATETTGPPPGQATTIALGRRHHRSGVSFEVFGEGGGPALACRLVGDPGPLARDGFGPDDCRPVRFPATALGVGLGALGRDFEECRQRFGEFLVAAGVAAYLPTDGTNVPDYLTPAGDAVAELQVCYGLVCDGPLACFARFEADATPGRVPLSGLVEGCLDLAETDRIGFVLLGETAGLMGAALRRSPVRTEQAEDRFAFPRVRDWLTFTAERAYMRSTALVVGVAARGEPGPLAPLLRPLGRDPALCGHCHAAAFSYRPLPRGEIDLRASVTALFEQQTLQGLLHLLADCRDVVGLGESEFVRGGCWFGPLGDVTSDGG